MMNDSQIPKPKIPLVKEAYEEAGRNYRYFLGWRERLLAGYFALLSGLFLSLSWFSQSQPTYLWIPFLVGLLLTFLIRSLERRNRALYRSAQNAARECEKYFPDGTGMYTRMIPEGIHDGLGDDAKVASHSETFDRLYFVAISLLLFCLVWIFLNTQD